MFNALLLFAACLLAANAADPDPVKDFCIPASSNSSTCKDPNTVTGQDFVSQVLRKPSALVSVSNFPALNTMGLSLVSAVLEPHTSIPLHTHPRSSELVYIQQGKVQVGFVDGTNVLYMQILRKGDVMVIPRGLIHFQYNPGRKRASIIAVFNSQEPGAQFLGPSLFGSGIPDEVITLSLSLNKTTIDALRMIFSPRK